MMAILKFTVGYAVVATLFTAAVFGYWAFGYLLLLGGSACVALAGYGIATSRSSAPVTRMIYTTTMFNIVVCIVAILGLLAMYYERSSVRGIDYANLGMAAARAEFNRAGERGGLLSVFGNIFSAAIYLPLINLVFDWERWDRSRFVVLALVIVGLLGLTYITGGRTALMIAVAVAAASMLGRGAIGLPKLPSFLSPAKLAISVVVIGGLFGAVFAMRASAFGASSAAVYLSELCVHLSQPTTEIMIRCPTIARGSSVPIVDDLVNYGTAVFLYAFHVAWVGNVIIDAVNPGAFTSFVGPQDMFFGRFGFELVATDYDGYFIPAAASLVYDFGYLEMILGFAIFGAVVGFFRTALASGHFFFGRIAFCLAAAGLLICVMISPVNLPVMLLAIMAMTAIVAGAYAARLIGLIPANSIFRELRRGPVPPTRTPK